MIIPVFGVYNAGSGGGGGFTPAYYTPTSYAGGWTNPENFYDGSGVTSGSQLGVQATVSQGNIGSTSTNTDETYSFASSTGFSQIVIAGSYTYELTSAATQYTSGSGDPFFQGYVTATALMNIQVSTDAGSNYTNIATQICNTVGGHLNPSGQLITGSSSFSATINSGSAIALPANLSSLKIRLRVTGNGGTYRNTDDVYYDALALAEGTVSAGTIYLS